MALTRGYHVNAMRERAKEHFPTVLLTLLSIVQALALELLWSHLRETAYLFEPSWLSTIAWMQIFATFLGLILIWVVYANNVMCFRWVPVTSDSVYPFVIGLIEFMLIETLGPDEIGLWFIFLAVVFGMMIWVAHTNMRRARQDSDNAAFFSKFEPAKFSDFYFPIAIACALVLTGIYLQISGNQGFLAILALLATNGMLLWQFYAAALFWKRNVTEVSKP
jgi:hypothetical protein